MVGAMTLAASTAKDEEKIREAFRTGKGLGWHEHHHDLFHGTERLFKPGYAANLVSRVDPRARRRPAGPHRRRRRSPISAAATAPPRSCCAEAYPKSTVTGFDYHQASIDIARKRAAEAGVADRVRFEVASAQDFPGTAVRPRVHLRRVARHGRPRRRRTPHPRGARPDGTWLIVEPMAGDTARGQRQPRRSDLLLGVDVHLHPGRAVPARRVRTRRTGVGRELGS